MYGIPTTAIFKNKEIESNNLDDLRNLKDFYSSEYRLPWIYAPPNIRRLNLLDMQGAYAGRGVYLDFNCILTEV